MKNCLEFEKNYPSGTGKNESLLDEPGQTVLRLLQNSKVHRAEQIGQIYEELLEKNIRHRTGTHYTPKPLAEEIVRITLEPLCRHKKTDEILALKICDPAMGCGVFLIEACRYLARKLVETSATLSITEAKKIITKNCLYGMDINPMAVELTKMAFQLETVSNENWNKNFHCGDSLFEFSNIFSGVFSVRWEGFDAIIGNPPFLGGRKMRGIFGNEYLNRLLSVWAHASLNADLCAFFFLRAAEMLQKGGTIGFLATNTIAQGDTARTGLLYLMERKNFCIRYADMSIPWSGKAAVKAAIVILQHGEWNGEKYLNGKRVTKISAVLDEGENWNTAKIIEQNREINFQGSVLAGKGFVLSKEEAKDFLCKRPKNAAVIFPFLGGNEVNTSPTFTAKRFAIDFRDDTLEYCEAEYPELLDRIRRFVKPLRDKSNRKTHKKFWWQHGDKRPALYARIRGKESVFVLTRHTKYLAIANVSTQQVFQESLCLLDLPDWSAFAMIQSTIHYVWARRGSSTLGDGLRYTPSDYFDTFPFLHLSSAMLENVGSNYYNERQKMMVDRNEGFTAIYNHFHHPQDNDLVIEKLRNLHRQLDEAVASAYGWSDLRLNHDFYRIDELPANDCIRFTIAEDARREILRRIIECSSSKRPKNSENEKDDADNVS